MVNPDDVPSDSDLLSQRPLYEVVKDELDREIASANALGVRATAVIGFVAVLLTLTANLIRQGLAAELDLLVHVGLGVGFLATAAIFGRALWFATAVVRPRRRGRTSPGVLRDLRDNNPGERELHHRLLKSLITRYENESKHNDERGDRLHEAYIWASFGVLAAVSQAALLGVAQGAN